MASQTQSLTNEWFLDVAWVYPATFQRSLCLFCNKKAIIYISSSFMFCKSLLKQAATPSGMVTVTFDLTVRS